MNPSSSSNAESSPGPTFKVSTRALSADLATAAPDESARDLGNLDADQFREILTRFGALDSTQFGDADPHLVATGRRGRFVIRPGRGKLLLRPANDNQQSYFELSVADVPAFLESADLVATAAPDAATPIAVNRAPPTGPGIAFALFAITVLLVAGSAYFTFRPDEVDPDSDYLPLTAPAEIASTQQQVIGSYSTGPEESDRRLEIHLDGTLNYKEFGSDHILADEFTATYTLAVRRDRQTPVLRAARLGTIEIRDANSLAYAQESYKRVTAAAKPASR